MIKGIITSSIALLHIGLMIWYYKQPTSYVYSEQGKQVCSIIFYGIALMAISGNNLLHSDKDCYGQKMVYKFHNFFYLILGVLYILHYSGILLTTNSEKLLYILLGVFVTFIIIISCLFRHDYFKKQ